MAYSILNNNGPDGKTTYVADSIDDLISLMATNPPMGTNCIIISEKGSEIYILNSQKQWVAM